MTMLKARIPARAYCIAKARHIDVAGAQNGAALIELIENPKRISVRSNSNFGVIQIVDYSFEPK